MVLVSTQPFMRCSHCQRVGASWGVDNEAYCCPDCEMDESGLEVIDPRSLIGTSWLTQRMTLVKLTEWYGDNNFRAIDCNGVFRTVSILSLMPS